MPGSAMWADITTLTPAAIAARNGTSSTESSRAQVGRSPAAPDASRCRCRRGRGNAWPWRACRGPAARAPRPRPGGRPGRVLAERAGIDDRVGRIVVDVGHRREGEVHADRAALERGDPAHLIGRAVAPGGAHAHIGGNGVPPLRRRLVPPSRSDATSSGSGERCCSRLSLAAMSSGEPTETMMPPTWSESTQRSARSNAVVVVRRVACPGSRASPAGRSCRARDSRAEQGRRRRSRGRRRRNGIGLRAPRPAATAPQAASSDHCHEREVLGVHRSLVLLGLLADGRSGAGRRGPRGPGCRRRAACAPASTCCSPTARRWCATAASGWSPTRPASTRSGISDVERLQAAGVRLVALFSPEHGFRGAADPGAAVASSIDSATGLPIYSLYGRTSAPTDEMLPGIDLLLVDLQDAGARYYTYLFTTVEVMRSAARRGIRWWCSTGPTRSAGAVQGNVLDTAYRTPVGRLAVPMRHGMTLGELARLARLDLGLAADLSVVPVAGWRREHAVRRTPGLPFIPPSPNLRSLESLFHYPGTLPVRRDQPLGRPGHRRAVRADRRPLARHRRGAGAGPGGGPCRACSLRGVAFTPRASRRRQVCRHHWSRASGSR